MNTLAMTTLIVPDYDAGIAFYTQALGLDLIEDTDMGDGKRWVVVGGAGGGKLLLAKAANDEQRAAIGNQAGGRVGWFLHTEDFAAAHERMSAHGVEFVETPRHEAFGTVAVFRDPFGNRWDLIEQAILPGTGRGTMRSMVEGHAPQSPASPRVPLHHPTGGPPPPVGEEA